MEHFGDVHYLPLAPQFYALLGGLLAVAIFFVEAQVLRFTYMRLGIGSRAAFLLLALSLLGSYVNIPIATLGSEVIHSGREVEFFGMIYRVPQLARTSEVVVAVNVGGAVVPTLLSLYLLHKNEIWGRGLIATLLVAFVAYALSQPVRGVGIALPIFVAPITAAIVAMLISWRYAPPLAYAGGSLGVLLGSDIANFDKLPGLGAPILSIGGAGTFDGIFLTGVVAVLLAGFAGPRSQTSES
jgi:uncharacterized membrane protein